MQLTGSEIREELYRRIDAANAQHELLTGFRMALMDIGVVTAYNRNVRFFGTVEVALFYAFVTMIYSFYETRRDTVNFRTLLDSIEGERGPESVRHFREQIADLKPLIVKVNILRNEAVGHQAIARSLADTHLRADLLYSDVEILLSETKALFKEISSEHFDMSSFFREDSHMASIAVLAALKHEGAP